MDRDRGIIDHKSEYYKNNKEQWELVRDLYEATPIIAAPDKYLKPRKGSEAPARKRDDQRRFSVASMEFDDRATTAHYAGLFGEVIDSLAGQNFRFAEDVSNGGAAHRDWGSLGDPQDPASYAYRIWHNADGTGKNYLTMVNEAILKHILYLDCPTYIEGTDKWTELPAIKLFDPIQVPMAFDGHFNEDDEWQPAEVLLLEQHRTGSVLTGEILVDQARAILSGEHQIHRAGPDGKSQLVEAKPMPVIYDEQGREILTFFFSKLALGRNIAHHAAHGALKLFELESYLTTLFRKVTLGMKLIGVAEDEEHAEDLKKLHREGSSFLWETKDTKGGTRFITPDTGGNAGDLITYLQQKHEEYRKEFFQTANDAARPAVTATQIIAEHNNGGGAFNAMMAQTMSDWETNVMRMMQRILDLEVDASCQWDLRRSLAEETTEETEAADAGTEE